MDATDIIEALHESVDDCPRCMVCDTQDDAIRAAIETALAEHEKQIRDEIVEGIKRLGRDIRAAQAVRIARGEPAPAQTAADSRGEGT